MAINTKALENDRRAAAAVNFSLQRMRGTYWLQAADLGGASLSV